MKEINTKRKIKFFFVLQILWHSTV
ncbi:unnamed protein product [Chironomus riparius]|uniref:Uncharacterized protein n=1 Tax=Chironomus riparius TaxID=315576 RepID=A0A9N9WWK5_9DIPT|nr:unnamed protein product [Chironomus riparius]